MKKFAAIALALILAMSSMFATVGVAGSSGEAAYDSNELSIGFEIKDNGKGVVVDVENMKIYGLEPLLTVEALETNYLSAGTGFTMKVVDVAGNPVKYVGTGTQIVLNDGVEDYIFDVVIFGDLTGDSVIDVVDAAQAQRISAGKVEATALALVAGDADKDGEISVEEYGDQVNAAISEEPFNQNATGTEKTGIVEVDEQVFVSESKEDYALSDEDVTLTYNDIEVDSRYFDISDVKYDKVEETGEIYGEVTITGKGLFRGEITLKIEVVSLLEKAVATVNEVIEDANLADVVTAKYDVVNGVADIKVEVNASKIIRGNFDVNMAGLNGLLTKIDEFKAENLQEATLTVGDLAIATNGDFDRSAIKALVFDIAKGLFCDIANADDNVVKSYSGVLVTNNKLAELAEEFNIDVVMTADADIDIDRVKAFAAKISRYVAFDVVDGNAVIDITMPASFSTKVVDFLSNGSGDVEEAIANFNSISIDDGFDLLSLVSPEDISAASVAEIEQLISVVSGLDAIVDKVLDEVTDATVTDVNGNAYELLSGGSFYIAEEANKFGAIVKAIKRIVDGNLLEMTIGNFANGDIYTVEVDATIDYRNISEKVIVNFDLFGAVETPDIIEETATYFSDIIAELGLANIAAVRYDAENCRALATLNARELATNLTLNEDAFEGLYTDIKGYFDDNYGTSTIVVGDKEIVTAGIINKTALKDLIFSAARGFFEDAANIGADNVLRSFNTVVTEADGTEHKFDLDFALEGSDADIERIEKIAAKVANYVSFEVVNGNAVVNVGIPAGMRNTIVEVFGEGDQATAIKNFNSLTLDQAFELLSYIDAEHISEANAKDIDAMVALVCSVDNIINKVLSKVTDAKVTTANGATYGLLSGTDFVVNGDDFSALVKALKAQLGEVKGIRVSEFANANGTYTATFDVAVSIGGIKETVVLNLDVFGDIEEKNAIEDTVDYVGDIFADLGVANFAAVELKDGKAVATFNASELVANGLNFNDEALDGLFTDVKDYFKANYSDSTIKVGEFELVKDGVINKVAVKDFIFDFAAGFFTDIANMDAATIRSYNTVVVDGEGNKEEFAFDFNLEGNEAHIERLQEISAKVAAHVSFSEVNGNAAVAVKVPAGMRNIIVDLFGQGEGVEAAQQNFNTISVVDVFKILTAVEADDISTEYTKEIEMLVDMACEMEALVDKVVANTTKATVNVNGVDVELFNDGASFDPATSDIKGLATAVMNMLNQEELKNAKLGQFQNANGTYTFEFAATVRGITEEVSVTISLF